MFLNIIFAGWRRPFGKYHRLILYRVIAETVNCFYHRLVLYQAGVLFCTCIYNADYMDGYALVGIWQMHAVSVREDFLLWTKKERQTNLIFFLWHLLSLRGFC